MRVIQLQEIRSLEGNIMEPLIISMGILLIIIIVITPFDKFSYNKNLHRLILFLNEQEEYNPINNKKTIKKRFFIFSEKIYRKLEIRISEEKYESYKIKLILSGLNDKLNVECILGTKIVASIAVFCYFAFIAIFNRNEAVYILMIVGTMLGFFCPDSIINIRIKKRQLELQKQLPNILKTLAVTTEAGLSFWEAIKKVCEIKNGVLIDELKITLDEVNMGILHREALMRLSERCKVTEISKFIFTIIQSLETGAAGVTKALNEQSNEVWEERKNNAKEIGQKASIRLFLSMLIFVFP